MLEVDSCADGFQTAGAASGAAKLAAETAETAEAAEAAVAVAAAAAAIPRICLHRHRDCCSGSRLVLRRSRKLCGGSATANDVTRATAATTKRRNAAQLEAKSKESIHCNVPQPTFVATRVSWGTMWKILQDVQHCAKIKICTSSSTAGQEIFLTAIGDHQRKQRTRSNPKKQPFGCYGRHQSHPRTLGHYHTEPSAPPQANNVRTKTPSLPPPTHPGL